MTVSLSDVKRDSSKLGDYLEQCDSWFSEGAESLKITGNLETQTAEHAAWLGRYDEIRAELKHLKNIYSSKTEAVRGELYKKLKEHHPRELGKQDIERYIDADHTYQTWVDLYHEVSFAHDKFESLVEAYKAKGFSIGHIVKLRVAALEDAVV